MVLLEFRKTFRHTHVPLTPPRRECEDLTQNHGGHPARICLCSIWPQTLAESLLDQQLPGWYSPELVAAWVFSQICVPLGKRKSSFITCHVARVTHACFYPQFPRCESKYDGVTVTLKARGSTGDMHAFFFRRNMSYVDSIRYHTNGWLGQFQCQH